MPISSDSLPQERICIVSRCGWTLYNFRRKIAIEAKKTGLEVVCVGADSGDYGDRLKDLGLRFESVPIPRRSLSPLKDLWMLLSLVRLFRRERPSIVHTFTIKPAIYATIVAQICKVPVLLVTITGLGHIFTTEKKLLRIAVEGLYKLALSSADLVFFQNSEDRDYFLQRGLVARGKASLVPGSGVDLEDFVALPFSSQEGSEPSFLMVARLLHEKGIGEFLAAARMVKSRYPNTRIRLVGGLDSRNPSGLSEDEFKKLNSDLVVDWIGDVDDPRPYIGEADVLVLPSYREGVPRSLLEGGAMGRALIAADVVGCREVVKDSLNGYLVPVGNAGALADAMIRLIESPKTIAEMGKASRQFVAENFDERIVIDKTITAYKELMLKKVGHAPRDFLS